MNANGFQIRNNIWYLNKELIGLAFFDSAVSTQRVKRAMVKALNEKKGTDKPPKCIQLNIKKSEDMSFEDFVTKNTINFR